MGLDITAYRRLKPAPGAETDDDGYPVDSNHHVMFRQGLLDWTEKNWPGRAGTLTAGIYSFADSFRFRAGSYGGYNEWRNELAKFACGKTAEEVWASSQHGPFVELISFADNEGTIGAEVSAKLAKDFADNLSRAVDHAGTLHSIMSGDGDWWLISYKNWLKAFEMAADGGAVNFH